MIDRHFALPAAITKWPFGPDGEECGVSKPKPIEGRHEPGGPAGLGWSQALRTNYAKQTTVGSRRVGSASKSSRRCGNHGRVEARDEALRCGEA